MQDIRNKNINFLSQERLSVPNKWVEATRMELIREVMGMKT